MPLYHVQDGDRPAWVIADSFEQALDRWQTAVNNENGEDTPPPQGISIICDDDMDIIIGHGFLK